ncbi:MAG: tetratricopeptide repeat protein, partial [Deltaproteobacteria bacterium]|nr:tetratricopeptide repeat protein [Deltaproteobacteria bacterium]
GNVLKDQGKPDKAISYYQKALKLKPDYPEASNNLGAAFQNQNKFDQAISCYRKALQLRPGYTEVHINMGTAFQYMCRLDKAISCYQKALKQEPKNADAHFHYSFSLLLNGNMKNGWKEYEWRLLKDEWKKMHTYDHDIPRWDGGKFKGKTLFVHAEQGLGDTLQFVRYLPEVKNLGGNVIFEANKSLQSLFQDFQGIDELVPLSSTEKSISNCDLYTPLMSIPGLLATSLDTIPAEVPYIHADPEKASYWGRRITGGRFKVGLVWAGKRAPNDNRPCELRQFLPLAGIPGVQLFGLQQEEAAAQVQGLPEGMVVTNLGEDFQDFADTAGAIANLDLVISIDTSVAHLAGAMGKTVWTLLPFAPDWRWLLHREDSPWYPTMRLFRQKKPGAWDDVLQRVAQELRVSAKINFTS